MTYRTHSKHWWLTLIKQNPTKVKYQLQEMADVSFQELKEVLDDLVMQRLISMHQEGLSKTVYTYKLTTLGIRYLNENKHEAKLDQKIQVDIPPSLAKKVTPVHHRVPAAPQFDGPPEPPRHTAPKESSVETAPALSDLETVQPASTLLTPADLKPTANIIKTAVHVSLARQAATTKLQEILWEKYADQISAKELIERL